VVLLLRLTSSLGFYALAVGLPGWLLGRRLVSGTPLRALLVGALGVLLVAGALRGATRIRAVRPALAVAGAIVGVVAAIPGRRPQSR
jgi:hypothetical protein